MKCRGLLRFHRRWRVTCCGSAANHDAGQGSGRADLLPCNHAPLCAAPLLPFLLQSVLRLLGAPCPAHGLAGNLQVALADQAADCVEVVAQPLGQLAARGLKRAREALSAAR